MAGLKCYIVDKVVDKYVAEKFGWVEGADNNPRGVSPECIASLRGLYDQEAERLGKDPLIPDDVLSKDLTEEQLNEIYDKLLDFKAKAYQRRRERIANGTKRVDRCWDKLRYSFNLQQRRDRINMISRLFSHEVDRLMEKFPGDRQYLVNGFRTKDGEWVGGKAAILEAVYNDLMQRRTNYYQDSLEDQYEKAFEEAKSRKDENGKPVGFLDFADAPKTAEEFRALCKRRAQAYTLVLENWNELIPFVLKDLVKKEGVKLGVKQDYAVAASIDSYEENDLANKWDLSEAVREGWQKNSDLESAFGSVGQQVRRILATIPEVEERPVFKTITDIDGNQRRVLDRIETLPVTDDLGEYRYRDATQTHQALIEFLAGVNDSEEMMRRFCKDGKLTGEARISWMQPIVDVLTSSAEARTQFFVDFYRNFQPYSVMSEESDENAGAIKKIKTIIKNKPINALISKYVLSMTSKGRHPESQKLWGYDYIFGEGKGGKRGQIDWKRVNELRKKVRTWVGEKLEDNNDGSVVAKSEGIFDQTKRYKVVASFLTARGSNTFIKVDGKEIAANTEEAYNLKKEFLLDVFTSLGFDIKMDTLDSILHSRDLDTIREELSDLFDITGKSGILYAAGVDSPKSRDLTDEKVNSLNGKKDNDFLTLYNTVKETSDGGKNYPVKQHIEKILKIISKHQEGTRVESRIRYQGNTMYSFVAPSYLGDRLSTIKGFVDKNDKAGLLEYLKEEYLCSPFFVDDDYLATDGESGKILNYWLAELADACDESNPVHLRDTVADIFTFERDLGKEDKKFEDFTSKEHGIDMLIHFFADEEQKKSYGGRGSRDFNKKLSALYPIFILGDAGVSKYIRAPRITSTVGLNKSGKRAGTGETVQKVGFEFDSDAENTVIDKFYDIYTQERRRMNLDKATSLRMYANGKEVKHPEGEFSILTFLNPTSQEFKEDYRIPADKTDDKEFVKKVIRQYMEDAVPVFKKRVQDLGILEEVDDHRGNKKNAKAYKYLDSIANADNIDSKLKEFLWNTKLATAQQLQVMTIDPSFYHGTKDLQKRYKEIHAPGNILDVKALDYKGDLYCPERTVIRNGVSHTIPAGTECMIYFDDIRTNAEETNPEFMEVVFRTFAKQKEGETEEQFIKRIDDLVNEGILTPKENKKEETKRQNRIADVLGKDYEIYTSYMKNTLTDGQGYRTLTSYRRVMGMAGKWTEDMDFAYDSIMAIRKKHEVKDGSGNVIDYTECTQEELKEVAAYALTLQPIKPYMFTHEKVETTQKVTGPDGKVKKVKTYRIIPVQHKYAEALIIPELMPKGKLRDLGFWMENNNVDMAGSTKISKVGCFGQANLNKVSDKASLETALAGAVIHELPYRDYRIQTNVPEHINASQLFGTQVRKLIMAGLNLEGMADFYADLLGITEVNLSTSDKPDDRGRHAKLNGRNLLALYNSLICANIMDSYDKFFQNASDIEGIADMLQQSTVGSMREAMDNLLSYVVTGSLDQRFMIPLYEGSLEHDASNLILSTFKKIVNKQQISGGSAVQVSAFGIKGYEEDGDLRFVRDPDNKKNILYAEIEMPFDKSFIYSVKNADGSESKQTISLDYDTYCNLDGTLIPSGEAIPKKIKNAEGKDITNPEWRKYQSYTYRKVDGKLVPCKPDDRGAEVYKPLIEEEYPDILSILAYRIPTERDYSMLNCRIKRFTSKIAGGTIKVPPEGTTIAGFDFDIDKLYFMQREYHKHFKERYYKEEFFTPEERKKIWKRFYQDNSDVYETLKKARDEWEAANPDKVEWITVTRRGRQKTIINPETRRSLNSFWKEANIEETFNKNKGAAFSEAAKLVNITPTVNVKPGESISYLEEYNFSKAPEDNTRASRNNLLISLIQARLMDPATVRQRYTPGGFANASDAALVMRVLQFADPDVIAPRGTIDWKAVDNYVRRIKDDNDPLEDPEPNYDPTDPYTILIYNQQNQLAAKLIGIFANQNTNHAFASCMDEFRLKEPIRFCGKELRDFLHKDNPEEAYDIDLNVAEYLAASVDAVKDPVLNFINLNTVTADAGAVLARLGYTTQEIGLLFNQPIIKHACHEILNRGVKAKTAIKDIRDTLLKGATGDSNSKIEISTDLLANGIIAEKQMIDNGKTTEDYIRANAQAQGAILNLFDEILKVSSDVSDFVMSTKFTASNAVSSTLGGFYAQQMKVDKYVERFQKNDKDKDALSYEMIVVRQNEGTGMMDKPITNERKYVDMDKKEYLKHVRYNPFAYEQAMYDANRKALKLLCEGWTEKKGERAIHHKGYFPYETDMYRRIREVMRDLAKGNILNEDNINYIHRHIPVALLAKQEGSLFDGEAVHKIKGEDTIYTNREYYRDRFAFELVDRLASDPDGLGDLEIFSYLIPEMTVKDVYDPEEGITRPTEVWDISIQDVGGMDADIKEAVRESWASLMEVDEEGKFKNPEHAELGRDLFMYCFYKQGFDFSPLSFMHLAPTAVKDNIIVKRHTKLEPKTFDSYPNPNSKDNPSDDVLVWSSNTPMGGDTGYIVRMFNGDPQIVNALSGDAFQLPDELDAESIRKLCQEARSHPELQFKIMRQLTQEEFDLFNQMVEENGKTVQMDVPSNIYFLGSLRDTISRESIERMSYGQNRTYRQFLYDIMDEEVGGLNPYEFAKMFALNFPEDSKFILNVDYDRNKLKDMLVKQEQIDENTIRVDLSSYSKEELDVWSNFVDVVRVNNKVEQINWCPFFRMGSNFYVAESGFDEFNVTKGSTMSIIYRKVEPMGSSKTIDLGNRKKVTPGVQYKSSFNAVPVRSTTAKPAPTPAPAPAPEASGNPAPASGGSNTPAPSPAPTGNGGVETSTEVTDILNEIRSAAEANSLGIDDAKWDVIASKIADITLTNTFPAFTAAARAFSSSGAIAAWKKVDESTRRKLASAIVKRNLNPAPVSPKSADDAGMTPQDPTDMREGNTDGIEMTRQEMEAYIFDELIAGMALRDGEVSDTFRNNLKTNLGKAEDDSLKKFVQEIKKACRKKVRDHEVLMLDSEGNLTYGC